MRYGILVLALAAIGVGAWMLIDGRPSESETPIDAGGGETNEGVPELEGMAVDAGPAPDATENPGRGEIVGTVMLGGAPAPARVELRVVARIEGDGAEAMFDVLGKVFVERLLDGGVATGGALDRAEAGADGRFRFKGLGAGLYELRARDAADRRAVASVSIPADRARVSATIDLPAGDVSLSGRVVFDDETPFRGTVVVSPAAGQMGPFMPARGPQAQTDVEGRFVIGGLAPGAVMVTAVMPGSIRAMGLPIKLPFEGEYLMTVGAGGVAVKGKVVASDTQQPIAGATVIAGGGNATGGFLVRTTTADAEGRFELKVPGVEGGMLAMAPGYGTAMVELRGERPDDLVVSLPKLAIVRGQLTAKASGEALAGVPVYAIPAEGFGGFSFPASTVTDGEGRFTMDDVHPGATVVFAYGRGWVTEGLSGMQPRRSGGSAPTVMLKPGEEQEQNLAAVPAGAVEGRLSADGKPVAGAIVSLERGNDFMRGIGAMLGMSSGLVTSVTDRDGRYVIDAVVPDAEVHLATKAVGFAPAKTDPFAVASGERTTRDIVLEAARWMTVTVVDADSGEPVPNAMVVAAMKDDTGVTELRVMAGSFFTTDARGRARVGPLATGVAGARAQAQDYLEDNEWTWFEAGASEGTVKVRKGLEIRGRITLPDGLAARQVEIQARYSGSGGYQREETAPKADGTFVLSGLREGRFRVSARAVLPGRRFEAKLEGVAAGTTDLELVLTETERGSMLTVRALDPKGVPVSRARISFQRRWRNGGSGSSSRTLSAGRATFELDDERIPDEVFIEIHRVEGGQGGALYHGPFEYEGGEIELTLPAAESIRGRATAGGKPVAGVRVSASMLRPGSETDTTNQHASTVSAEDGSYTLEGLGPYEYQVHFAPPGAYEPVAPRRVRAGSTRIDLDLAVGATASVTVLDAEGAPVAGARLYAQGMAGTESGSRRMQGNRFEAIASSAGVAELKGLPQGGTFQLRVNPPQSRPDLRSTVQEGWTPRSTTIQLERAFSISGIVRDKHGAPVSGGDVRAHVAGQQGSEYSADVDTRGRFTLKQLPEGEFDIWYEVEGAFRAWGQEKSGPKRARARAGATEVAVLGDFGLSLTVKIANWTGENHRRNAQLAQEDGQGNGWTQIGDDGTVRFHRLVDGKTYTFSVSGLPGGRYVYKTGLRPGDSVTLRAQKGRTITGRVRIPPEAVGGRVNVSVQALGSGLSGEVDKNGRFEIQGVPEGTWKISAWIQKDDTQWSGEADLPPGGEVEITVERRR